MKKLIVILLFSGVGFLEAAAPPPSSGAYKYYLKALLHESEGNIVAAKESLALAIEQAPESAYLHRTAAVFSFRLGKLEEAQEAIDKAIEYSPDDIKAHILGGQIYWALGNSKKSEELLKKAVELDPDATEALATLALAVSPRAPREAINLYNDFLERHPETTSIREQVAQLHQSLGDFKEAKSEWSKVLEWEPDSIRAHLSLAQIAEVNLDSSTAITHYEAVLERDPSNLPLLLRVGELRYRNNNIAKAYEAFSRAQKISKDSPSANFWLALLSEHKGDWEEAIRLLEDVVAKAPDQGIYLRLSYYYSQMGRYKDAIKILKRLSEEEPENTDFLNYLAVAYDQDKQYAKAEKTIKKLLGIDSENPEVHFYLATIYDKMGKFEKAEAGLKTAIKLDPKYHMALNYLGYSYADKNIKLEEAEKLVMDAIALDSENGAYMDSMGWVYYRLGKLRKAEDFLVQATQFTEDPLIWEHLGDVQAAAEKPIVAILSWDASLALEPGQKRVLSKIQKKLKTLDEKSRQLLFVQRVAAMFMRQEVIKGLAHVEVCDEKPCFDSKADFNYVKGDMLRIEIPGPLSGPVMLLEKPHKKEAKYGAIHPLFHSVEKELIQASKRFEEILDGAPFKLSGVPGVTLDFNDKTGRLNKVSWGEESVEFKKYNRKDANGFPLLFKWSSGKKKISIQFELINPTFGSLKKSKDEK